MENLYLFHPSSYAIGETEKFYSDMAAKGWKLEERGRLLSHFQLSKPSKLRYRVEIIPPKFYEEEENRGPTSEQLSVFRECGWRYVTGHDAVHIFCTRESNNAPELYLEPIEQAAPIKKLRNRYILYLLGALFFFSTYADGLFIHHSFTEWITRHYNWFIENPALEIAHFSVILIYFWFLFSFCKGLIKLSLLHNNLQKGIPLDHSPKSKWQYSKIILFIFVLFEIIGLISYLLSELFL